MNVSERSEDEYSTALEATMTPSQRAYCDVALAINQRRNMFVALSLGLDGATPPKNAPRYRVEPVSGEFFHIVDTGTGKLKGFRREPRSWQGLRLGLLGSGPSQVQATPYSPA